MNGNLKSHERKKAFRQGARSHFRILEPPKKVRDSFRPDGSTEEAGKIHKTREATRTTYCRAWHALCMKSPWVSSATASPSPHPVLALLRESINSKNCSFATCASGFETADEQTALKRRAHYTFLRRFSFVAFYSIRLKRER